ncbi:bifunctional diaminohydroxyphosphoribosylaminopyrimidine deaminase/5-amino-6-(5-phosphoribosylamino)uracil reductase RibD [Bacillus carboniphilus]|uniref:Riboflavin biosynthesis protein RibD n=1 Tax=Bacillus carboniphilus TaxID=86663 RepID=A0ABY9JYF0_9BACI|nr:bifunctional diaminohydroxyphosphoribosylaminopyrimidine deaminase/5-amino-6-(5-phosphoribosylamino)uracil reductase RibD [Bacillus carboniphilus]WLR43793.1 bifunctional diaminohydroxyphosphoribosylaminopyrimidine deaminase/5-amino-6-(5-phosphoribosylamino)uracil reductase RibD [Bacillus carboniphilus]
MDERFMKFALEIAEQGRGQTGLNPLVGAVVVKDHKIVGFGAHLLFGEAHAEVHALKMAGEKANGATLYVTLEPCNHYGKTPPCCLAIVESKIKRVVVAMLDPNPIVCGKGVNILRENGIDVRTNVLEEEALKLNKHYVYFNQNKRPFITLKYASTLDGKIATRLGDSKWITGKEARLDSHSYRANHQAIMVGIGTVLQDDPLLTCREIESKGNPIRMIVDRHLRVPLDAQIITNKDAKTWILTTDHVNQEKVKELEKQGVAVHQLKKIDGEGILKYLAEMKIMSVFVEGGSSLLTIFYDQGLFNELVVYLAPKVIGGSDSLSAIQGKGIDKIKDAKSLRLVQSTIIGEDLKLVLTPK